MKAVRFYATIGDDRIIRLPREIAVNPGRAEVIVLQPEEVRQEGPAPEPKREHLFDRLANAAQRLGIDPKDLPTDLAENHAHYAHGAPKSLDRQ
jgi:hypothetical protein